MKQATISFPVVSFRNIESPFPKVAYRDYLAIVSIEDLPDLSDWRKINVRDPKLTGAVPTAIRKSVSDNPDLFVFMNRGIVVAAEKVSFDNKSGKVTITMQDPKLHGLLDGGHTYNIVREEQENLECPQYVKLELLEGFTQDEIPLLVDARNTSNQVRDQSLMNLQGEFDKLKKALGKQPYADSIAYKEHEVLEDDSTKPLDVRDIIAVLTCFDRCNFDSKVHPINAYRSKAACLSHFAAHKTDFEKIYPIAGDALKLFDEIQIQLPELYNQGGGRFGKLTGVATYKHPVKLPFTGLQTKYGVPAGFIYPVLGAFRALLEEKKERYVWAKGLNPFELLKNDLGQTLANTIGTFALDARNPSKTGKSPLVWQACYQAAEVSYLRA
ncbi:MAG TPA: AIPR family protein [Terracidiphilus sp.]|nr:AIPR family protein [Terracidiphilus sp.]